MPRTANWRRGLFRLWVVFSIGWIIGIGWSHRLDCAFGQYSAPWCVGYGQDPYVMEYAVRVHALVFGVPALTLLAGLALIWVANGFRGERPNLGRGWVTLTKRGQSEERSQIRSTSSPGSQSISAASGKQARTGAAAPTPRLPALRVRRGGRDRPTLTRAPASRSSGQARP